MAASQDGGGKSPKDTGTAPSSPKTPSPAAGKAEGPDTIPPASEGSQGLFLQLMAEQLAGWENPRVMLERALRENLFLLLAQRVLPLKPGGADPLCYEVLLRLKQEEDSLLPPGGFLGVAESLGMMPKIDRWVVRAVLTWCAARQKKNPASPLPLMCINISAPGLRSKSLLNALRDDIPQSGVPARALCFEINERDVIEDPTAANAFIAGLKPLGCRFTIDSFGSVRISFAYLNTLPVDFIKIDGIIIESMHQGPLGPATVKAINMVCHDVGMRTIAEFVETKETLRKLQEIGVDYVQGFGVAKPGPIGKLP